jgi:hypothetical protein
MRPKSSNGEQYFYPTGPMSPPRTIARQWDDYSEAQNRDTSVPYIHSALFYQIGIPCFEVTQGYSGIHVYSHSRSVSTSGQLLYLSRKQFMYENLPLFVYVEIYDSDSRQMVRIHRLLSYEIWFPPALPGYLGTTEGVIDLGTSIADKLIFIVVTPTVYNDSLPKQISTAQVIKLDGGKYFG